MCRVAGRPRLSSGRFSGAVDRLPRLYRPPWVQRSVIHQSSCVQTLSDSSYVEREPGSGSDGVLPSSCPPMDVTFRPFDEQSAGILCAPQMLVPRPCLARGAKGPSAVVGVVGSVTNSNSRCTWRLPIRRGLRGQPRGERERSQRASFCLSGGSMGTRDTGERRRTRR